MATGRATTDPYSLPVEPGRPAPPPPLKGSKPIRSAPDAPVAPKTEQRSERPDGGSEARRGKRQESPSKVEAEPEEDDARAAAAAEDEALPEVQPSHPRNEVDIKTAEFRQNALHVYGLDFLKRGHMDEIFSQFNHKYIEWINDSSANIVFADPPQAKKALESLSFPKPADEPWRRTPDILVSEDVPPIFLQMRLATAADTKPTRKAVPTVRPQDVYTPPRRRGPQKGGKGAGPDRGDRDGSEPRRGPGTKRPRPEPTEEERALRQKRATRFKDWLVAAVAASAEPPSAAAAEPASPPPRPPTPKGAGPEPGEGAGDRATAAPGVGKRLILEVTEEEIARRKRRLERFGGGAPAAAGAPAGKGGGDAAAASAGTAAPPSAKAAASESAAGGQAAEGAAGGKAATADAAPEEAAPPATA